MKNLENIINKTITKVKKSLRGLAYAGVIGLALVGGAREAKAVNSNSIVKDNIEYYMQTDKSVYDLGEHIEMLYRWKNVSDSPTLFKFFRATPCNFFIERDTQTIWLGQGFYDMTLGGPVYTLGPLEFKEYNEISPGLSNTGYYQLKGVLISHELNGDLVPDTTLSVPIEIIPAPSVLILLGTGLMGLLAHRRKK